MNKFKIAVAVMMIAGAGALGWAEEKAPAGKKAGLNIMEVVLFLNANMGMPEGSDRMEADREHESLRYYSKDGRLVEEHHLDEQNTIVSTTYGPDGSVKSVNRITEASIRGGVEETQRRHDQEEGPAVREAVEKHAQAAEAYAKAHGGAYPIRMQELTQSEAPYLGKCLCDQEINMYHIICDLENGGYRFTARSLWPQYESYVITTGDHVETKGNNELPRALPLQHSKSPCEETGLGIKGID